MSKSPLIKITTQRKVNYLYHNDSIFALMGYLINNMNALPTTNITILNLTYQLNKFLFLIHIIESPITLVTKLLNTIGIYALTKNWKMNGILMLAAYN